MPADWQVLPWLRLKTPGETPSCTGFMLANDTATLACEVPVYLYPDEAAEFGFLKKSGVDSREGVTGHIDLVQIRYGYIHLLDFKPMAAKAKYAGAQLLVYTLALSARTGIWLRNFVCGWFDEKAILSLGRLTLFLN